ncbi:MAG: hypothetical protein L6262_03555 [Weeksellaceae bacterium]|nr:hypothetical protein [Weeksellaceae bacterium]
MKEYDSNAFGGTFAFSPTHKAKLNCKRATKPTHDIMYGQTTYEKEGRRHNITYTQAGFSAS